MATTNPEYEFGPFRVDPAHRTLRRDGEMVAIPPKPLGLLLVLIEHRGEVLSKDRLIEMLWSGAVGTEANLSVNIATLRRILGEKPRDHQYIVTIPQQGYSFVAEVRVHDGAGAARQQLGPASPIIRQLAVLPFRATGLTTGSDYIGPGLSDSITSELTLLRRVAVRETSSTRRSAGPHPHDVRAGHHLGVDAVVEGTIRKTAGSLGVTARLVRVADSAILWQQSFTTSMGKLPQVGQQIAGAIRAYFDDAQPTPKTLTENADAFRAYLQGRKHLSSLEPNAFEEGVALFQQAIALDPSFALAHVAVARTYYAMWWLGAHSERPWSDRIEEAARRAMELDPTMAEAYVCLGLAELGGRCRFEEARVLFEQALALAPMSSFAQRSYGQYCLAVSDFEEALRRARLALSLDPTCFETSVIVGYVLMIRREYSKAIRHFQALISVDSRFSWATFLLSWCHLLDGDCAAALDLYRDRDAGSTPAWMEAMVALIHSRMNNPRETEKHLAAWEAAAGAGPHSFYWCAIAHIARQDVDQATVCLEKAHVQGDPCIAFLNVDPRWDPIRSHPRFQGLVQRVSGPRP